MQALQALHTVKVFAKSWSPTILLAITRKAKKECPRGVWYFVLWVWLTRPDYVHLRDDKTSTGPSAFHFIDTGKENIDPNADVSQPVASSSSAPPTDDPVRTFKCVFSSCSARISGKRKYIRRHLLSVDFQGRNRNEKVACACGKTLKISSLPQHIASRQHYNSAPVKCDRCKTSFSRGYMLEKHEETCEGAQDSKPKTKKRRIA